MCHILLTSSSFIGPGLLACFSVVNNALTNVSLKPCFHFLGVCTPKWNCWVPIMNVSGATVQFSTASVLFSILPKHTRIPVSLHPCQHVLFSAFTFVRYFFLCFSNAGDVDVFIYMVDHLYICGETSQVLCPFFNQVVWFLWLSLGILFVFWIFIPCYKSDMLIFSPILWFLFNSTGILQTCFFFNPVIWLE